MLTDSGTSATVMLASAVTLTAFFTYLFVQKRQGYMLAWVSAWALVALHFVSPALEPWWKRPRWLAGGDEWLLAAAALVFLAAARLYVHASPWIRGLVAAAVGAAVWAAADQSGRTVVPLALGTALIFLVVASVFWTEGRRQSSHPERMMAGSFALWSLLLLAQVFQAKIAWLAGMSLMLPTLVPQILAGALMVMAVYEEERRRVERNMLALSNLNLATSSFGGGEIPKMLSQALERVLNVARIPAGALCLHHGDAQGPPSVVANGLADTFCAEMRAESLDEYLIGLVSRLGGLVVLRDLARDSAWAALEREPAFRQFRHLLVSQRLRTVVGISLQAKDRAFGALLLGTPDSRQFTPAELRLLLALGHQIGMAVENSYLIQQTSRRSEELHMLNEIGRALSSTLEADALFEKIYSEMSRLFHVGNFYVALFESRREEIRFELEVQEGVRQPKRSRAPGNYLLEYMIRTRQPVLIRHHFAEELRQRGCEAQHASGSFCGVPLVLYDRPIGVMAVYSQREGMFDEGHLELLRVLASEAGIALENARLFAEEQKKSRQLSLLNNISSHAISTLNPDEMISKIAEELENSLSYDHIGIATLDYSAKELVVQAEAGRRREARGRRIALGEGLVGQVARSGQMAAVREINSTSPRPILPGSVSAIALPITYADQLLGVLYSESSEACDFSEEETLLLRTLADLFAGALHNALAFQKAQEQAITDGLTGVKTHRFLMEALSAEWKRATRVGRPFSLVLLDLDRFKFVNDFYGHLEGDTVLQRIAHILEQNCRRSDVVARYGGDEFVILMPETSVEQARQLAGKLRGFVGADALLHDKNITASFGIATFPVHGSTPQELIQVADSSMYISKHHGGNAVSTSELGDADKMNQRKRDVLEAYLGVTLKRQFATGPQAFEEISRQIEHFSRSLGEERQPDSAEELPAAIVETMSSLALAVDAKGQCTQGHSPKVAAYAGLLAQAAGFSAADVDQVRLGGLLHDVGKVGIPESILNKAGPLDAAEWETMKEHPMLGARLLEPLPPLDRVREMVLHHHEFFDGSGYPDRLEGEQIPLGARIMTIADAYDTITSERGYKKAQSAEHALAELERCAGQQFDPELVRLFLEVIRRQEQPTIDYVAPAEELPVRASR